MEEKKKKANWNRLQATHRNTNKRIILSTWTTRTLGKNVTQTKTSFRQTWCNRFRSHSSSHWSQAGFSSLAKPSAGCAGGEGVIRPWIRERGWGRVPDYSGTLKKKDMELRERGGRALGEGVNTDFARTAHLVGTITRLVVLVLPLYLICMLEWRLRCFSHWFSRACAVMMAASAWPITRRLVHAR